MDTTVTIQPKGYTYQADENQSFCQIGLHPLQNTENDYRFGKIFLRNFYTALEYDKSVIMLRVNEVAKAEKIATLEGATSNPYPEYNKGDVKPDKEKTD